jgi:hypothetical protein
VPIERAFSGGADLISKKRCSLSKESIQAYVQIMRNQEILIRL